jgi:hypothetical protein
LFRRGLRDRPAELEKAAKMPRSVKRAIAVGEGGEKGRSESRDGERHRVAG